MHKNATKCKETLSKWCKNKHGASKIIDTFEMYHISTYSHKYDEHDDSQNPISSRDAEVDDFGQGSGNSTT
jgi:hypothetical protein